MSAIAATGLPGALHEQEVSELTAAERDQVRKLLGNPLEFPAIYNGWLESHLDTMYVRKGAASGGRPLAGTNLDLTGNANVGGTLTVTGAATVGSLTTAGDIHARDYYGRNETLTGSLAATVDVSASRNLVAGSSLFVQSGDMNGSATTDCRVRNFIGTGMSLSGNASMNGATMNGLQVNGNSNVTGTETAGAINVGSNALRASGSGVGFFGTSPRGQFSGSGLGAGSTYTPSQLQAVIDCLRAFGLMGPF